MASAGKRVLMLIENQPYPQDIRVCQEAITLVTSGYQVTVISRRSPKQPLHEKINGVYVFRYPSPPDGRGILGYLWEYSFSLISTFLISLFVCWHPGFDIIHAANPPDTAVFIAMFFKLLGKRFVFDHHDLAPEMFNIRFTSKNSRFLYRTQEWLEILSCHYADHVIATNQSYKVMEIFRDKVPEDRITIVRNGPSLDRLQPVEADMSLKNKASTILGFVGVMAYQDGLDYLLRALHSLMIDLGRSDFFCVIIGKGDSIASLKALSTQLGLDNHVWFTGYIPDADLICYLSTVDICLDPDPSNPFNDRCTMVKMMEYMAMGKPIVAFDLPEHRVTAQEAALYARPNEELDFARQIVTLMDNSNLRESMGKFGKNRVDRELAWSHQEKHLQEAYAKISDKKPQAKSLEKMPINE